MVNLQGKAKYPVNQAVIDHRWWPMLTHVDPWNLGHTRTMGGTYWNILKHEEVYQNGPDILDHFCGYGNAMFQHVSNTESVWASNQLPSFSTAQINVLKSHGQSSHESILIPNGYAMQIMRASQDRRLNLSKKWCFCICGTVKLVLVTKVIVGLD